MVGHRSETAAFAFSGWCACTLAFAFAFWFLALGLDRDLNSFRTFHTKRRF